MRARILLRFSNAYINAAEDALLGAIAVARRQKAKTYELLAALDLARLYCDRRRERHACEILGHALTGFAATPSLPEIGEAQSLLASLGGEFPRASGQQ